MGRAHHALAAWNRAGRRPRAAGADRWPQRVLGERSPPASGAQVCPDTVRRPAMPTTPSGCPGCGRIPPAGSRSPSPSATSRARADSTCGSSTRAGATCPGGCPSPCRPWPMCSRPTRPTTPIPRCPWPHAAAGPCCFPAPITALRPARPSSGAGPTWGPGGPRSSGPASRPRRTGSTSPLHGAHTETTGESSYWSSALCRWCRRSRPASSSMWTSRSTRGRCHRPVRRLDSPAQSRSDPLWQLPVERIAALGPSDPVAAGEVLPPGYTSAASQVVTCQRGRRDPSPSVRPQLTATREEAHA